MAAALLGMAHVLLSMLSEFKPMTTEQIKTKRLAALKLSKGAAGFVFLVGCLALAGWAFDIQALIRVLPGLSPINPMTACSFVLCGISLWCLQSHAKSVQWAGYVGRATALLVVLVGFLKLGECLFAWGIHIDQLFFQSKVAEEMTRGLGLMSPNTALNFFFCGLGLMLLDKKTGQNRWASQTLVMIPLLLAWIGLIGYLYNPKIISGPRVYPPMALHTALAFIGLTFGILLARPERGVVAILTGDGAGGIIARRLLPIAVLVPSLLGGFRIMNQRVSLFGSDLGVSLMVMICIVISTGIIYGVAASLNRTGSEHKRMETGLRDSEKRFRSIWQNSGDGMRLTDGEGIIIEVNPAFCRLVGMSSEDLVGRPMSVLYYQGDNPEQHLQKYRDRFKNGQIEATLEQRIRFRSGKLLDLACTNSFIELEEGKPLLLVVFRDISERKRAETASRESEERFRALSASSPMGVYQTDIQGRCLYTNAQWLRITDQSFEESLGDGWMQALHPEDHEKVVSEWNDCIQQKRQFISEFRLQTSKGVVRWVRSRAATIIAHGEIVGYVGTTEDITERKQAEEQMKRFAADLEKGNGELKEALANVRTLRGLLPICSGCKKIRDDTGYWNQIEFFIRDHSDAKFSHGMCPECSRQYFPDFVKEGEFG
ncbi:MAG: putative sensor protein [Pedosphaera sp.]|nr:putative sensor protein [Pedosphaera sp.]